MIKKNGANKYVVDYGAILQMIIIIGVIVATFYHRIGQVEMMINENSIRLEHCQTQVTKNTVSIKEVTDNFHEYEVSHK